MLSGIRVGKRKRRSNDDRKPPPSQKDNADAAAEIRKSLLRGGEKLLSSSSSGGKEKPGRITDDVLVLTGTASMDTSLMKRKEDFRHGARKGKLSKKEEESSKSSSASKMTIEEMIEEEKEMGHKSMDESYARNISRLGSKFKNSEFKTDDDDGNDDQIDTSLFQQTKQQKLTQSEIVSRDRSRQIAHSDRMGRIMSRCWWWIGAGANFRKWRLLALGDHVSMVMAPSNLSLVEGQCYLVPVKHAESFVSCDEQVWDEVQRFRSSLRSMFAKEGKGVLFCETVLPKQADSGLWQARMDVIPVPRQVEQDAEIYFKSALTEQAEEWGTHQKLLSTTPSKTLQNTIPNKNFPYFNIEWNNGGFVQIIEGSSFSRDFGLDTCAGMMELDPVRFKRKRRVSDEVEKGEVLKFCAKWKKGFDWTLDLDGGLS